MRNLHSNQRGAVTGILGLALAFFIAFVIVYVLFPQFIVGMVLIVVGLTILAAGVLYAGANPVLVTVAVIILVIGVATLFIGTVQTVGLHLVGH